MQHSEAVSEDALSLRGEGCLLSLGKQDTAPKLRQRPPRLEDGRDARLLAASQFPVFPSLGKESQILAGHPYTSGQISFFFFIYIRERNRLLS